MHMSPDELTDCTETRKKAADVIALPDRKKRQTTLL